MRYSIIPVFLFFIFANDVKGKSSYVRTTDTNIVDLYVGLSPQQLLDTGYYLFDHNNINEALVCFTMLTDMTPQSMTPEYQRTLVRAYTESGNIYYLKNKYRMAYGQLLEALQLNETVNDTLLRARIFINFGNIYHRLGQVDLSVAYFFDALALGGDSSLIMNNIGYTYVIGEKYEEAYPFLIEALRITEQKHPDILYLVMHSIAAYYQHVKLYDSAFYYYKLALEGASQSRNYTHQHTLAISTILTDLGEIYFETRKFDSAIAFIHLSNETAKQNDLLEIQMQNNLLLSKIAESKGDNKSAFRYYRQYSALKDSVFNRDEVVEISQLQRLYEISKANRKIEKLTIDQQVKDKTIRFQKISQWILTILVVILSTMFTFIIAQYRTLNTAYKKLFEKDRKITEYQKNISKGESVKYVNSNLTDEMQNKLLEQIYALMEDTSVVCDPDLSVEKLADMLQSNRAYVSQVINSALDKNFRSFINEYRIREATRLFSEKDASKYTIESVALMTGFKSRNTFNATFKEITGVSPSFYLKSMQNM